MNIQSLGKIVTRIVVPAQTTAKRVVSTACPFTPPSRINFTGVVKESSKLSQDAFDELASKLVSAISEMQKREVSQILQIAKEYPDVAKVLKMKNLNPYARDFYINLFKNKPFVQNGKTIASKITDDFFQYYLDVQKSSPEALNDWTLRGMNDLLNVPGVDEKFVKELFEKCKDKKDPFVFLQFCEHTSENNIEYLKHLLKNNQITTKIKDLLELSNIPHFKNKNNWSEMEHLYDEVYIPFYNSIKDHCYTEDIAKMFSANIIKWKYTMPEKFKILEENNILQFIIEGKINPRILSDYATQHARLLPEILEDAQKLSNGESAIKKLLSLKNAVKNTSAGDVISVDGKMYINNNGKIEPWNMTEEKFNELFPLVDRFSTRQGQDDCYLISVLNSLYLNPRTRGSYYKMFEQKGDDILVTIPAYKEYGGPVKFPLGKINTSIFTCYTADAAKHVQMMEQAYSRVALRAGEKVPIGQDPLTTTDLKFLNERVRAGNPEVVMREYQDKFPYKNKSTMVVNADPENNFENIMDVLKHYVNNPRYVVNETMFTYKYHGHVRFVKSYNPYTKMVTVVDPSIAGKEYEYPLSVFTKKLDALHVTRVG